MIHFVLSETSTGKVIKEKTITDNWWETYIANCQFSYNVQPIYTDDKKTMICIDKQRNRTHRLTKLDN